MVYPHKEFEKASCKDANIEKGYLADMFDYIEKEKFNIHSMLLIKDGTKVFDAYASGFEPFYNEEIYSVSKSFTSIAIGICQDKGYLKVNDKVLPIFKDELSEYLPGYDALTIKHLLTMSTGQDKDVSDSFKQGENPYQVFFNCPLTSEPGSTFMYNNGATFMLSAIVTKLTSLSVNEFLNKHVFSKIFIDKPIWDGFGNVSFGAYGLKLNTIDLAKFGLLLLKDGRWRDEQLVSKAYIDEATTKQIDTPNIDLKQDQFGYGYQFWMNEFGNYRAAGWKNQYIIINKQFSTVFVIQADEERSLLPLFSNYILPALEKGWTYDSVSLRDYVRRFHATSEAFIK